MSRRTRSAFRDHCSNFGVVRLVAQAFENEGFESASDADAPDHGWDDRVPWDSDGQRRGTLERCAFGVDWTDPRAVRSVLDVFEELMSWCSDDEFGKPQREKFEIGPCRDRDSGGHSVF